jgi:Right handed beta helix region
MDMSEPTKINFTMKRSNFSQASKCGAIFIIVVALLLSSAMFVSAQSQAGESISVTQKSYLPFTVWQLRSYYVSPSGNDLNPGTYNEPWKTLAKASSMIEPGSVLYLRGGTYNGYVSFRTVGTKTDPVWIMAYPGEKPVIDGQYANPGSYAAVLVIRGDYIHVANIEVRNSALMGVYIYGNYDTVSNLNVHHNKENGIVIIHGSHSTVENSLIWRNVLSNEYGKGGNWSTGLSAARDGVTYATIRNNVVWENWGEGISTFEADHTVIENNITHDNYVNNIYISDSTNVLCQRNLVYTNSGNTYTFGYGEHEGIALGDEVYNPASANIMVINNISIGNQGNFWWWQGPQGGGMNNVLIANNTFVNGMGEINHYRANVMIASGNHHNVRFENNIIQQDDNLAVIDTVNQPGITYSNNLWSSPPETAASGAGDIIGNARFTKNGDPFSADWYTLTAISPAINTAISLIEVTVDYFGAHRPALPDMGADELIQ